MTKQKIRKIMNWQKTLWILAAVFLLLGTGSLGVRSLLVNRYYTGFLQISPASPIEERQNSYLSAIALAPDRAEAYSLLLDTYLEDGSFSQEESGRFLAAFNGNHFPRGSKDTASLRAKIGMAYISSYDGSFPVRIRLGLPFLQDALAHLSQEDSRYAAVLCYTRIGSYYSDYIWDATAVRDVTQDEMADLLTDIQETLNKADRMTDFDRLSFYRAVCDLILDQRDTIAALTDPTISLGILDSIYDKIPAPESLQKDQSKAIAQTLMDQEANYREMLQRAILRMGGAT